MRLCFDNIMTLSKKTIWNYKQNKPSLIVKDITDKYPDICPDFLYSILLKRGVFKWLSVRRDLIRLKEEWRNIVRELCEKEKTHKEIGYLKAMEDCRKRVRKLCHSDRWRAPDFDRKANEYLRRIEK